METNDERRKRRLAQLCELHGGVRTVAEKADISWATLDQILKGTLLPAKADGTRSPRSLGDENARALEDAFDLGRGWFDWPFDAVDGRLYYALNDVERGVVQGAMNTAIRDLAERKAKSLMRRMGVKKDAVPDHEVERAMPITQTKPSLDGKKALKAARPESILVKKSHKKSA